MRFSESCSTAFNYAREVTAACKVSEFHRETVVLCETPNNWLTWSTLQNARVTVIGPNSQNRRNVDFPEFCANLGLIHQGMLELWPFFEKKRRFEKLSEVAPPRLRGTLLPCGMSNIQPSYRKWEQTFWAFQKCAEIEIPESRSWVIDLYSTIPDPVLVTRPGL